MRLPCSSRSKTGFTFVETLFAVGLVATFFVTLFAVSSQCMYFVNASRELLIAGQTAQSRLDQVRNCTWTQLTDANYIANNILNTAVNGSSSLGTVTEVVTINAFPTAVSPAMQITRSGGTTTINSTNSTIASGDMATINVLLSWSAAPGARSRSLAVSTTWVENVR